MAKKVEKITYIEIHFNKKVKIITLNLTKRTYYKVNGLQNKTWQRQSPM